MPRSGRWQKRLRYEVISTSEQIARLWRKTRPTVTSGRIQAVVAVSSAVVWVTDRYNLI